MNSVNCSTCGREMREQDAVASQMMKCIDGNPSNLAPSNLREVGISYHCHLCVQLECLDAPPLFIHNKHFKQGYEVGRAEGKTWKGLDELSDEELLTSLKGTFHAYAEEPNEEALFYSIGSTIGLLTGMTVQPVIEAWNVVRRDGDQADL